MGRDETDRRDRRGAAGDPFTIVDGTSTACIAAGGTTDTSWWRLFVPATGGVGAVLFLPAVLSTGAWRLRRLPAG